MIGFIIQLVFAGHGLGSAKDVAATHPEWVSEARQLIGESDERRLMAMGKLRARFLTVESLLQEADGEYRPYALDVLVALRYPESVDRLIEKLEGDPDGAITLALNALLTKEKVDRIAERYGQLLKTSLDKLATAQILAMVDFFTHVRRPCMDEVCLSLLKHPRLEVQQAAVLHFAVTPKRDKVQWLTAHLAELYPQVRAQAILSLYDEEKSTAEKVCRADSDPIVKSACEQVIFKVKAKIKKKKKQRTRKVE